ncbi:MAG: hypothetical protein K6E87_02245 [bacterium]|nr:hypothetical protein [bacterium]
MIAIIVFLTTHIVFASNIDTTVHKYTYENHDVFYSDSYFAHSATEYDPHLATLSILMADYSMNTSFKCGK